MDEVVEALRPALELAGYQLSYRKQEVSMGLPSLSEYEIWQTDEGEIRACAEIVHSL